MSKYSLSTKRAPGAFTTTPLTTLKKAEQSYTLYDSSTGTDLLSSKNKQGQSVYEVEEESIADLRRNFNVGRSWDYIFGLADILRNDNKDDVEHNEYSRAVGFPSLVHLIELQRAVQSAYMQGLTTDPLYATSHQVQAYYADYITDREQGGAQIIELYESGNLPLTPLEQQAFELAQSWKQMVTSGQQPPSYATASPSTFESISSKWDDKSLTSVVTSTTSKSSGKAAKTTKVQRGSSKPSTTPIRSRIDINVARKAFGVLIPNTEHTKLANAMRIFAIIGISYALIQANEYRKSLK